MYQTGRILENVFSKKYFYKIISFFYITTVNKLKNDILIFLI